MTLIAEKKFEKAEEIIDLAMEKMPVEKFGFYTIVVPFVDGYYKVGRASKAKELYEKMKKIYQERLSRNIDVLIDNSDRQLAEKETLIFNEYIDKFSHFYKDSAADQEMSVPKEDPDMRNNNPSSDTIKRTSAPTDSSQVLIPN